MAYLCLLCIHFSTIAFRWDFIGSFFCVRVPEIISKLKNKNFQSEQDVDQDIYSAMEDQQFQNKQHGVNMPKKERYFYVFYRSI